MVSPIQNSFNNRSALAQLGIAGCCSCLATFTADKVVQWTDDGATAVCPCCGLDAVLPGIVDAGTLLEAQQQWYGDQDTEEQTRPAVFSGEPER